MIKPLKDDFLKMYPLGKKNSCQYECEKKHSIIYRGFFFHVEWQLSVLENTCLVDLIAEFSQPGFVALPLSD